MVCAFPLVMDGLLRGGELIVSQDNRDNRELSRLLFPTYPSFRLSLLSLIGDGSVLGTFCWKGWPYWARAWGSISFPSQDCMMTRLPTLLSLTNWAMPTTWLRHPRGRMESIYDGVVHL